MAQGKQGKPDNAKKKAGAVKKPATPVKRYTKAQLRAICLDSKNRAAFKTLVNEFLVTTRKVTPSGISSSTSVRPVLYETIDGLPDVPVPGYMRGRDVLDDYSYPDEYREAAVEFALDTKGHAKLTVIQASSYLAVDRATLRRWINSYKKANPAFKRNSGAHVSNGYTIKQKLQAMDYVNTHLEEPISDIAKHLNVPPMTLTGWLAHSYQQVVADYQAKIAKLEKECDALRDQLKAAGLTPCC